MTSLSAAPATAREEKENEETKEKNKTVVGTDEWQAEQDKQKKLADTKKQFDELTEKLLLQARVSQDH